MGLDLTATALESQGLDPARARGLATRAQEAARREPDPTRLWSSFSRSHLGPDVPYAVQRQVFECIYRDWDAKRGPAPAWVPTPDEVARTHLAELMKELGLREYADLRRWASADRPRWWRTVIGKLGLRFTTPFKEIVDLAAGPTRPRWLPGARFNSAESCLLAAPERTAIVHRREGGALRRMSYGELDALSARVAAGLVRAGFVPGDAVAIAMTMNAESVAIYLGILRAGCAAVSIADSFAPEEIATRLRLAQAKGIFTQDLLLRGGKKLPMYDKVAAANAPRALVLALDDKLAVQLRPGDLDWRDFLGNADTFPFVDRDPEDPANILFSSGTTGEPKVIPWTHTTPIKCAADAWAHHDVHADDVLCWPTNLGWMMGPWLIFASLVNRATLALFDGAPTGREFGAFVEQAGVTMLGVVPSMVKTWRSQGCLQGLDWTRIRRFSSTGECSNPEDMFYLMLLAGWKPVIEYCGGTEIGGGYIAGTLLQPASPSCFTTPTLGSDFVLLDENGRPCENGEVFLIGPAIGFSNTLLNRDHDEVYYRGTPPGPAGEQLRRHGDQIEQLPGGWWRAHGRTDDTMNLGGIKTSSAEIEAVLNRVAGVYETAAIAVPPEGGGPSLLVIHAVPRQGGAADGAALKRELNLALKTQLNPYFKVHDLVLVESLPRTASNKILRRVLRDRYLAACAGKGPV